MAHQLTALWRNIPGNKKSAKVADEARLGADQGSTEVQHHNHGTQHTWKVARVIFRIIQIPLAILSCYSQHENHGVGGATVTRGNRCTEAELQMTINGMRFGIVMM
ncbi:hypothetical protein Droror1_Dr00022904 [Drosera rotundifolia]